MINIQPQTVNLTKGQNISLTKTNPSLKKIKLGLGWKENDFAGKKFDLDASAIMLSHEGKVRSISDFIFYGNTSLKDSKGNIVSPCKSVIYGGDNQSGKAEGDAETILIDLSLIPAEIVKIVFPVSIYGARKRQQNFGQVSKAYIRLINEETTDVVTRYDLSEDYSTETALVFGELYRVDSEWKFKAVGQGFNDGLAGIGRTYGMNLEEENPAD
jgi:tellurium resistance protein TerD